VRVSEWDCTLGEKSRDLLRPLSPTPLPQGERGCKVAKSAPLGQGEISSVVRLGLRMVNGLSREAAVRIAAARAERAFESVADLAQRAQLNRRDLKVLAAAGALTGLAGHRHRAHWAAAGIEPETPLLKQPDIAEGLPLLRPPTEGEDIVADYAHLGLTLGRHPLALLRPQLAQRRYLSAAEVRALAPGAPVRTAGIVVCRQHPSSANGVIFVTLEDETGHTNAIVWANLAERQRRELLHARLLGVTGEVQREGEVLHVIAKRLEDRSALLGRLLTRSRDFH